MLLTLKEPDAMAVTNSKRINVSLQIRKLVIKTNSKLVYRETSVLRVGQAYAGKQS